MSAERKAPSADRRSFGRRPTNMHAVAFVPGRPPMHCVVCDVSEGGALLDFGRAVSLPGRFSLRWEAHNIEAQCEVRRIEGGSVGVLFLCGAGAEIARIKELEDKAQAQKTSRTIDAVAAAPLAFVPPVAPALVSEGASLVQRFRAARR